MYDIFDRYAQEYDAWFDAHPEEYCAELARIRKILPRSVGLVVEVGAGSGRFAAPLGAGLGIEPSLPLARMARQRGVDMVRGVAECLPMKNGSCASIVLITVLCYLDDPRQAFAELSRVLVSDGTLLIGFLEKDGAVARRTRTQPGKSRFLSRARFYASGEIASFLARAGLSIRRQDSRAGFCIILAQKRKGFSGLLHDPVADPDSRSPEPTR